MYANKHSRKRIQVEPGNKFGFLTVIRELDSKLSVRLFELRCVCGKITKQYLTQLRSGKVISCKCVGLQRAHAAATKHGLSRSRVYSIWDGMISRCYRAGSGAGWKHYGARGIKTCKRWRKFVNFLADMGQPPDDKSCIDRINPEKNYCKSNCRWAPLLDCSIGTRRAIKARVKFNGEMVNISRLARRFSLSEKQLRYRIVERGMKPELAVELLQRMKK